MLFMINLQGADDGHAAHEEKQQETQTVKQAAAHAGPQAAAQQDPRSADEQGRRHGDCQLDDFRGKQSPPVHERHRDDSGQQKVKGQIGTENLLLQLLVIVKYDDRRPAHGDASV